MARRSSLHSSQGPTQRACEGNINIDPDTHFSWSTQTGPWGHFRLSEGGHPLTLQTLSDHPGSTSHFGGQIFGWLVMGELARRPHRLWLTPRIAEGKAAALLCRATGQRARHPGDGRHDPRSSLCARMSSGMHTIDLELWFPLVFTNSTQIFGQVIKYACKSWHFTALLKAPRRGTGAPKKYLYPSSKKF